MTQAGDEAITMAEEISRLWPGHHPAVVGAALAQALAIWIASLPEQHRTGHLEDHIASVKRMIPVVLETRHGH